MNEEYELKKENAALREVLKKIHKAFCDGLIGAHSIATDAEADALFRLWHEEIPAVLPPDDDAEEDDKEDDKEEIGPTAGLKLWRVTVEQVCSETVHVWAKTLKEARDAVNEDLGDYESQVHQWELDEVEETSVYEGEPTDPDSDYEEEPDEVHGNIYIVKGGKLADLD